MKPQSLEKLVWALIYGGMLVAMLGLWAGGGDAGAQGVAIGLAVFGGLMVAAGAVLVWVRSRLDRSPSGAAKGPR